jgi:restriction system protein
VFGTTSLKKINFPRKPPRWKNHSPLKLFSLPAPTAELGLVDGPRLLELIKGVQRIRNEEPEPAPQSVKTSAPVCAKCGTPMVLRSAKRGANAGNSFWGCSSYPKCTGTRPV